MVLSLFPNFSVAYGSRESSMEPMLEILHEIDIPLPPDELPRPAIPVMSTEIGFDPDISIAPVQFSDLLPPVRQPPASANASAGTERSWVPFEVAPTIRNRDDYLRAVQRGYPVLLRNAGIGGTVFLAVLLDETGSVMRVEVDQSSGHAAMDAVAVEVTRDVARFSPAISRDLPVSVWVRLPVSFVVP